MGNSFRKINPLLKSGGVMTGLLTIQDNRIKLVNGSNACQIRSFDGGNHGLEVRTNDNVTQGYLYWRAGILGANSINMDTGNTVDGVDISATKTAHMKTGYYTGDGTDNRNINIGVDLTGADKAWVLVKATDAAKGVGRSDYMISGNSHYFDGTADAVDKIQSLTSTGFQVGTGGEVNTNTQNYTYIAFWKTTLS